MDALSLTPWKCTIYSITHLANAVVYSPGVGVLEITLEDIDSQAKYLLKFTEVLGYRFEAHFNEQNLVNTFKVEDSAWIKAIETKPFRTKNIESIQHYLISTMCGEFQVVCLTEPAIELIEWYDLPTASRGILRCASLRLTLCRFEREYKRVV